MPRTLSVEQLVGPNTVPRSSGESRVFTVNPGASLQAESVTLTCNLQLKFNLDSAEA